MHLTHQVEGRPACVASREDRKRFVSGFAKGKTGLNLEECGRAFRVRYGGLFSESLERVRFQWSLDRCT
jgi:hypothetical protein